MIEMDYVVSGMGKKRSITARSARAKARTPEPQEFQDNESALPFVRAGVQAGYRFSGRELIDCDYELVRYGYFVKADDGRLRAAGQDWGPPDPVFEKGDIYPGGVKNGMQAKIVQVITGEFAQKAGGVGVMVVLEERRVDPTSN
jgi:hypothetical protein